MAKITALTADAAVIDTDLCVTVEDPSGTPVTKKATWATIGVLFAARSETLTNKTISGASNTVSNLAASTIASGTLVHERGGLEADVSAYSGLVKIAAGATSAVTAPAGAIVGDSDTQTLTNKTISGASNTVSNLAASVIASGTLVHERGGLEADVSAYSGWVKIASGATSAVAVASAVETWAVTPSSANLASAVTGETGSGALVFGTSPTISGPTISGSPVITATDMSATGNARGAVYSAIASVQTTDATVTSIYTWTPPDEAVSCVTVEVCAVQSTGATTASYVRRVRIKRDGGTVTVGTVEDTYTSEEAGFSTCDVTIDNSGTTARVRVTGVAATTIDWACVVTRFEVTHA